MFSKSLNPQYFPADLTVSNYGPETEHPVEHKKGSDSLFKLEKRKLILRMLRSDVFTQGHMSLQDIANVTQVDLKLVKKIHRDLRNLK